MLSYCNFFFFSLNPAAITADIPGLVELNYRFKHVKPMLRPTFRPKYSVFCPL